MDDPEDDSRWTKILHIHNIWGDRWIEWRDSSYVLRRRIKFVKRLCSTSYYHVLTYTRVHEDDGDFATTQLHTASQHLDDDDIRFLRCGT